MTLRRFNLLILAVLACGFAGAVRAATPALHYVPNLAKAGDRVILDTRKADLCEEASLPGARCLPAEDFLGQGQRLAGFANIAWLLGSAGLTGAEKVLVVGGNPVRRDFVAGLLHIMGQQDIAVLAGAITGQSAKLAPGEARAMLREQVWQAPARDRVLVFINELRDLVTAGGPPQLLDGRPERAFWGRVQNAARGGHLPGAEHFPAVNLRSAAARGKVRLPRPGPAVVYGAGPVDGIAYMTLLIAGGADVRVFPGGWAKWAANGALPADAETFPAPAVAEGAAGDFKFSTGVIAGLSAGLLLGGGLVVTAMWALGRRKVV